MGAQVPNTLLEVIVTDVTNDVGLLGVCAGFENQEWRYAALAADLIRWAPDWILKKSELSDVNPGNMIDLTAKALSRVYQSDKFKKRGEIGELLLHIVLRKFMGSDRAISRIYFKDAPNDTVKGFDAVHVVAGSSGDDSPGLELWLGESKFYKDSSDAITEVLGELETHLATDYLRTEFAAITDKIEPEWEHSDKLLKLLDRSVSLDMVFSRIVVPVFITFDSEIANRHKISSPEYTQEMNKFVRQEWDKFRRRLQGRSVPKSVRIHLIMMPLDTKKHLLEEFDRRLKSWQQLTA